MMSDVLAKNCSRKKHSETITCKLIHIRARVIILSHFRIPSSSHLEPIFTHTILNVGFATPAVVLTQIDSICLKSGRQFLKVIVSQTLIKKTQFYYKRHFEFVNKYNSLLWNPGNEVSTQSTSSITIGSFATKPAMANDITTR